MTSTSEPTPEQFIAHSILNSHCIYTLIETDEFCIYNYGVFHRGNEALSQIRSLITELADSYLLNEGTKDERPYICTIAKRNEIIEKIKSNTFISLTEFEKDERHVIIENGVLTIRDKPMETGLYEGCESWTNFTQNGLYIINEQTTFARHFTAQEGPYKTFTKIPLQFDPAATCLQIDQFLTDIFGFEKVPLIYEMIGYFLMPTVRYQKAFILYGSPNSGKTTFIELLMRFFGGANPAKLISQVKLHHLSKRFQLVNLMGKVLNIFDDLPHTKIGQSDIFRIVVTNNFIQGEKKHVQGYISWINRCKFLYTCNELPPVSKDMGDADWRRWIIIPCFSEFKDKEDMTEEDYQDPKIFEKNRTVLERLCTPQEFSGLLNKAIDGYVRLVKREHFPKEWDDIEQIKGLWQMDINPVKLFVDECCEIGENYQHDYYDFWNKLNVFRKSYGYKEITQTLCTQSLGKINENIHRSKNRQYYEGIKIVRQVIASLQSPSITEPILEIEQIERIVVRDSQEQSMERASNESLADYIERTDRVFKKKGTIEWEDEEWNKEF